MLAAVIGVVTLIAAAAVVSRRRQAVPARPPAAVELDARELAQLSPSLQALVQEVRLVRASLEGTVDVVRMRDGWEMQQRSRYRNLTGDETDTPAYRSNVAAADANLLLADLAAQAKALPVADRELLAWIGYPAARLSALVEKPPAKIRVFGPWRNAAASPDAFIRALEDLAGLEAALKQLDRFDPYRQP